MINVMGTVAEFAYVNRIMSTIRVTDEYPEQNKITSSYLIRYVH